MASAFKYDTDVLDCLAASGKCLSAYEISRALSAAHKHPVRAVSIYRCLARLVADGLALKVVSQNAFIARTKAGPADGCGLLVITCHICKAYELQSTAYGSRISAAAERAGFRTSTVHLEVIGQCARCRSSERVEEGPRKVTILAPPSEPLALPSRQSPQRIERYLNDEAMA